MKQKNKRGFFLAEETVKIVLAVIVILFLAGFLFSLYYNYQTNKELEIAKTNLQKLVEESDTGAKTFDVIGSRGWQLISYSSVSGVNSLQYCDVVGWENCICICKKTFFDWAFSDIVTACKKNVFCLESQLEISPFIILDETTKLKISDGKITK